MIARLSGTLIEKQAQGTIIDIQGVGYYVYVSTQTVSELPAVGKKVTLRIYHHITDQSQSLFGFQEQREQDMFELLITVKGIGPKGALGILSGMPIPELADAIASERIKQLTNIPGIGKRTAERLCVELKDKVAKQVGTVAGADGDSKEDDLPMGEDAISALLALGYNENKARKAVRDVVSDKKSFKDTSALIKASLEVLNS